MKKAIVIGAGICGVVVARELAQKNYKVTLYEKNPLIGGVLHEHINSDGIIVQNYGINTLHTDNYPIITYLRQYAKLVTAVAKCEVNFDGVALTLPFNFNACDLMDKDNARQIKSEISEKFPLALRIKVQELLDSNSNALQNFGKKLYNMYFTIYNHLGLCGDYYGKNSLFALGQDDRMFGDKYQAIPELGFVDLFNSMLCHKNIKVKVNTNACNYIKYKKGNVYFKKRKTKMPIIACCRIDELHKFMFGKLDYVSISAKQETFKQNFKQKSPVVVNVNNKDVDICYEYKHLTKQMEDKTTVVKIFKSDEKSGQTYFLGLDEQSIKLAEKYASENDKYPNLYRLGWLANYEQSNIAESIEMALALTAKLK